MKIFLSIHILGIILKFYIYSLRFFSLKVYKIDTKLHFTGKETHAREEIYLNQ